jgi:hypothetical protein
MSLEHKCLSATNEPYYYKNEATYHSKEFMVHVPDFSNGTTLVDLNVENCENALKASHEKLPGY